MRILHVIPSLDCGGMERVVIDLARMGASLGQHVEVVCLERPGVLADQLERTAIRIHCLFKRPGVQLSLRKSFYSLFTELQPTVVHVHQIGCLFYSGPAARKASVPLIVHTDHGEVYTMNGRTKWLARIAGRYAERLFCVSEELASEVKRRRIVPSSRVDVIHNGVDVERFSRPTDTTELRLSLGIGPTDPVLGTVGRLNEVKRQDFLIRGFASVKRAFPSAHLIIVGDGELMPQLRELAVKLSVGNCVHFVGFREDRESYLHVMDLFALTSRFEGMPISILEAWSAELPVVASDVGGLPNMIDDRRNGRLFSYEDMEMFVAQLEAVLSNPGEARRLGMAGRNDVNQRFSLRTMAERYHESYLSLLAPATRPDASRLSSAC